MSTHTEQAIAHLHTMSATLQSILLGKEQFIEHLLIGLISGGHILIEDMPGLGKTTIAKGLAQLIQGATSSRIQCTPDLLPYDITGVEIYNTHSAQFHFERGPIFADVVLADELNRASPKTQSALLEAMAERQVTVSNKTYKLSSLFFVIATQNPIESEICYELPVAELDRFLFKLSIGYPDIDVEQRIIEQNMLGICATPLKAVLAPDDIAVIKQAASDVHCDTKLVRLAVHIAAVTRSDHRVECGVSPRGTMGLIAAAKARALFHKRDYITDEDITTLVPLCYPHRMKMLHGNFTSNQIINEHMERLLSEFFH